MSRVEEIAKLKEDMTEFTKSITSTLQTVGVLNPEAGTNIAVMALHGAYVEQMTALNETMAMIYDDIHDNPSPYTISNLRRDMMARGATAQELATLSDLVKKYKGE